MKLKNVEQTLKEWTKVISTQPKHHTAKCRAELDHIQDALNQQPMDEDHCKRNYKLRRLLIIGFLLKRKNLGRKAGSCGDFKVTRILNSSSMPWKLDRDKRITHLVDGSGNATTDLSQVKYLAPSYYYHLFNQTLYWNVFRKLIVKKTLTFLAASWLIRQVSKEEIKNSSFQKNGDKSPGPDGFNAKFFPESVAVDWIIHRQGNAFFHWVW